MVQIETCVDCNSYDDVSQEDTFMYSFGYPEDGTEFWLCGICTAQRNVGVATIKEQLPG